MNIHELSAQTGISLTNLRKLEKLQIDFGNLDPSSDFVRMLRVHLGRGQAMTVAQLLTVLDDMDLLDELEMISRKQAAKAGSQIIALGRYADDLAPVSVTGAIERAARGDDDAVDVLSEWMRDVLPIEPVPFAWLAVRLLFPLNEFLRGQNAPLLTLAFLNVRKSPGFAGFWHAEEYRGKNTIKYHKPLASLDL